MEDISEKCDLGASFFANKPPLSPKPFNLVPSSTTTPMAGGTYEGFQKPPYLVNHGDQASNYSGAKKPPPEPLYHDLASPPFGDGSTPIIKPKIPALLFRNPMTVVESSSTNNGGITVKTEQGIHYEMKWGRNTNPNMDSKRLKRILSNRISAQKSRLRKLQYINDMEKKAKDLEAEIAMLVPCIESQENQNKLLRMENNILKERLSVYEDRSKLSLPAIQEHRAAVQRLRELYATEQKMWLQGETLTLSWNSSGIEQMANLSSHESGPQSVVDSSLGEVDPSLNFKTLTIDPPKSLNI